VEKIHKTVEKKQREIGIVQFGEGNFLRGFVEFMLDIANEKGLTDMSVAVVKPIAFGSLETFRSQDCVYTVLLRGRQDGKTVEESRVVTCIDHVVDTGSEYANYIALAKLGSLRAVVSNTTEAGIVYDETDSLQATPPKSYPGKLTQFLLERWKTFNGAADKGLVILPVELIEKNGERLHECVMKLSSLWRLPDAFVAWLNDSCVFCNTLVDRIITGYPADDAQSLCEKWGYEDKLIVAGEPFAFWVIESSKPDIVSALLPLDRAGLPVVFTDNIVPYRERKVRILNGAHTGTVLGAFLAGIDTVGECMADETVRTYLERMMNEEIGPTVPLPKDEVDAFAASVIERFSNPFIRHLILSIALNSVSKWKSRLLPSLLDSKAATGELPRLLVFSFAALLAFYTSGEWDGDGLVGKRPAGTYPILDDKDVLEFFAKNSGLDTDEYVRRTCAHTAFWGQDLNEIEGFSGMAAGYLKDIRESGARAAIENALK